jgi:4-amino-4-deoxy-L-arabinose transferase-like glycosyltransferase
MRVRLSAVLGFLGVFVALLALHYPLLRLPYFWDEGGYYIPAALDFYNSGRLIPISTLPTGHPPLVTVYLALVWHLFGFSPLLTRLAMTLVAAANVTALYVLGRRVASREVAAWSALLLALSPLFFAQSSLAHLDLAAGLFTTLAAFFLLQERLWMFALTASLAVLSKETAAVLLPVAWVFAWYRVRARRATPLLPKRCLPLAVPLLPLLAWAFYYHHATGFWTGNAEYLQYNLYSTLNPFRAFYTMLRRLYELLIGGFNWLLVLGAGLGIWWRARTTAKTPAQPTEPPRGLTHELYLLAAGLCVVYVLMLSVVGGAVLPRYLLPVFPLFYLVAVLFVSELPGGIARAVCAAVAVCFVWAWFINPPCPFPFEDNLSYRDFVLLHQQAAQFLEGRRNLQPPGTRAPRVLTAWPASDELSHPYLGYVQEPLRVVSVQGFTPRDFAGVTPESFDLLYLYSLKWQPRNNLLVRFPQLAKLQERYFDYAPPVEDQVLVARFDLKLLRQFERRGQWVRIYSK